jgi:N6-L-threonylcarbamoyladenine synthase
LLAGVRSHESFEVLGQTLDDAAGEALDKAARLLGLGYPGGPAIERLAADGDLDRFDFPVAMTNDPRLDFSFSGLKTAFVYAVRELGEGGVERHRADLAASFQAAVVDQLVVKLRRAARGGSKRRRLPGGGWRAVALGGGVAANSLLRERVAELCDVEGLTLKLVAPELCTDNAAMIGSAARFVEPTRFPNYLAWDAK